MKKGIVPLWISLFFSFLAVALLLVFYFVFLRGSREPDEVAVKHSSIALTQSTLLAYLNSPVVITGETMKFADALRIAWKKGKPDLKDPALISLQEKTIEFIRLAEFDYAGPSGKGKTGMSYALLVYTKPPGERKDQWLCIDTIPKERVGGWCGHPTAYPEAYEWESKATTFVPVGEKETLYVAMLLGIRT